MEKTIKVNLWLASYNNPDNFELSDCLFMKQVENYAPSNYVLVGEGKLTVTKLTSKDEMVDGLVKSLNEEKKKLAADYEVNLNRIDSKINQLLAIENKS